MAEDTRSEEEALTQGAGLPVSGCPHCGKPVFRKSAGGQKVKARTKILVLHKSGEVEINCPECGRGVLLPLTLDEGSPDLRKAELPRFIARKA